MTQWLKIKNKASRILGGAQSITHNAVWSTIRCCFYVCVFETLHNRHELDKHEDVMHCSLLNTKIFYRVTVMQRSLGTRGDNDVFTVNDVWCLLNCEFL